MAATEVEASRAVGDVADERSWPGCPFSSVRPYGAGCLLGIAGWYGTREGGHSMPLAVSWTLGNGAWLPVHLLGVESSRSLRLGRSN